MCRCHVLLILKCLFQCFFFTFPAQCRINEAVAEREPRVNRVVALMERREKMRGRKMRKMSQHFLFIKANNDNLSTATLKLRTRNGTGGTSVRDDEEELSSFLSQEISFDERKIVKNVFSHLFKCSFAACDCRSWRASALNGKS